MNGFSQRRHVSEHEVDHFVTTSKCPKTMRTICVNTATVTISPPPPTTEPLTKRGPGCECRMEDAAIQGVGR